jgi:arginine decarboxylase
MEKVFWKIMGMVRLQKEHLKPEEREELEMQLADTYFTNFSLFQSLPDSWAIDQLFPVIPIHRLDEQPDQQGVIVDLTCDSDGLIDNYIGESDVNPTVPLHRVIAGEPYYLGIFLVGAYQETLGELHNLFGDPHAVQVQIRGENQYKIRNLIKGDTVNEVISYVSYDTVKLTRKMREQIESAVENRLITIEEAARYMKCYEDGMRGYTYFED